MKQFFKKSFVVLTMIAISLCAYGADVKTIISGLQDGDLAMLTLSSETYVASCKVTSDGEYEFKDVPEGLHSVKVETTGYNLPSSKLVRVKADGTVEPNAGITLVLTKMGEDPDVWHHKWESDGSIGGYTSSSYVNSRPEIEFLGKKTVPSDVASQSVLMEQYNVILADEEMAWTQEYAYRLLETLKTLPCDYRSKVPVKVLLTDRHLTDDMILEKNDGGNVLTLSLDAFAYANPFLVNLDGVRGRFFSKRLHHAMTRYVTDFGADKDVADRILSERFGVSVNVPDYVALTATTTKEDASAFQEFLPSELVAIINMFEELPEGFHVTPNLKYLIRRITGHPHPIHEQAAAVSWCIEDGYIEFMVSDKGAAFSGTNEQFETQRLILHEKAHFLWAFTFSDEIKNDWAELGGWYRDPNAKDDLSAGWSTSKTTEFVSAYSHAHNPNEDMAESVAFYLKDPEKLMSRSLPKYEFIRDRIMHGTRYISSIPDHLTFEVLNLYPDYDYPGKIKRVDISVEGAPEEKKRIVMEIELNHEEGFQDDASIASVRITSPVFKNQFDGKSSQFVDLVMSPVDGNGHVLRGEAIVSEYSKSGYWICGDIVVSDLAGNERFEGRNDCVTNVYVNNPKEDLLIPEYESGSLEYELTEGEDEGHPVQFLKIRYRVNDNVKVGSTFARVDNDYEGWSKGGTDLTDAYGTYDEETGVAEIIYIIPEFYPTANYFVSHITSYDLAGTEQKINFTKSDGPEGIKKIHVTTPNPDYESAEIDLNRMIVYAEPTHPENPDGETKVTVTFYAKDNISGVGPMQYYFRDPQGIIHGNFWFYHRNYYGRYLDGDPTVWERYQITHILPRGSAPGIWGLSQMMIADKAGNERTYNFVETLIFEPDDSEDGWDLFADWDESELLKVTFENDAFDAYGFTYRIINEETGEEISGDSRKNTVTRSSKANSFESCLVDVSSISDGNLLVIASATDDSGATLRIKTVRILKNSNSSVGRINVGDNEISVIATDGKLEIKGVDKSSKVDIYSVNGVVVFSGDVEECESRQFNSGICIIRTEGGVVKIHVR